jgi:hypothetical protein
VINMPRKHSFPVRRHTYDSAIRFGANAGHALRTGVMPEPEPSRGAGAAWQDASTGEKASLGVLVVGAGASIALLLSKNSQGEPRILPATLVMGATLGLGAVVEGMGSKPAT